MCLAANNVTLWQDGKPMCSFDSSRRSEVLCSALAKKGVSHFQEQVLFVWKNLKIPLRQGVAWTTAMNQFFVILYVYWLASPTFIYQWYYGR